MANIQHIPRDDSSSASVPPMITVGTISSLAQTTSLADDDLFEVSQYVESGKYASRCVSWKTIMAKCQNSSVSRWNEAYADECHRILEEDKTIADRLSAIIGQTTLPETDMPVLNDTYALSEASLKLNEKANAAQSTASLALSSKIAYSKDSKLETSLSTFNSDGNLETSDASPASLSDAYADSGSGIHNGFVLAFEKGKNISTEYACRKRGVLQLYGWLDTRNVSDSSHLESGWCAIEGYIRNHWEIMQLQQVIPNKSLTYVGFCVPVNSSDDSELKVRVRCGFLPASASNRYPSSDVPTSLSNHVPNAFVGGIYVNEA